MNASVAFFSFFISTLESIWYILKEGDRDGFLLSEVSPMADGLEFIDVPLDVLLESLMPDYFGEFRFGYLSFKEDLHRDSELCRKDGFFEVFVDNKEFEAVRKCVLQRFESGHMNIYEVRGLINDATAFLNLVVKFVGGL